MTDAAAFRPVAAAYAACDVVPAQLTPDGVSDAERHRLADETIGDHEWQRLPLRTRPGVFVAEPRRAAATLGGGIAALFNVSVRAG